MNNPLIKKSDLDLALARLRAEGGGGGTSNYNDLSNKPSINSVTLSGNKTSADLGLANSSEVITAITFNGNPVTVTNNTAAIQSVGDVQDVKVNASSVVTNGVANIPLANGSGVWGLVQVDGATEPGSSWVGITRKMNQGTYTYTIPTTNLNGTIYPTYLPDATYTQKGAVTLDEWIGTITDNYDEYGNEGYDSTLDGYVRTVTTTDGHFTLTSGNKIRIDNVSFSGYHKHFLNVDGTGAIELLFAPNYSVYTGEIGGIVVGSIDVLYNGTNYIIINGYAYKQPTVPSIPVTDVKVANGTPYPSSVVSNTVATIPAASTNTYGVIELGWANEPPAGWVKLKGSNQYSVYVPYLYAGTSDPTNQTIRAKWLPDASSSVKGAVIVDNAMSDSSTNPVQNSVVKAYIDSHSGNPSASDVTFDDTNCSVIQAQEVQTAIEGLDFYLNDTMGRTLPSVTASDNGKVLTVVNGAWAKGTSSGGGVSDVTVNGTSVVSNNVAAVIVPTEAADISFDDSNCNVIQARDCQEGIEGLDYQLDFLGGLFNTRVPVLQTNGTYCLTATKSQGGNPSYAWGNAKGVSTITSGGTDAVNSAAVIDYINSLDATNTSY